MGQIGIKEVCSRITDERILFAMRFAEEHLQDEVTAGEAAKVFYFICAGHGAGYNLSKAAFSLALAMAAICFLYPGFVHYKESDLKD